MVKVIIYNLQNKIIILHCSKKSSSTHKVFFQTFQKIIYTQKLFYSYNLVVLYFFRQGPKILSKSAIATQKLLTSEIVFQFKMITLLKMNYINKVKCLSHRVLKIQHHEL